jgi:hypothetical protein
MTDFKKHLIIRTIGYSILFTLILLAVCTSNADNCTNIQTQSVVNKTKVITTDVPKHLKDASILIRTNDGRISWFSANKFKIVPRKQQYIVTERIVHTDRLCKVKDKNILMVGARRDHQDLDTRINGKTATVQSEKGLVLDAAFMRKNISDSALGLGIGIDTNGTLKGLVGVEF